MNKIERMFMFAMYANAPIICIENFMGFENAYFLVFDFIEANPSNHIHVNTMRKCKFITSLVNQVTEIDQGIFINEIDKLQAMSIQFSMNYKWFKVK